MLNFSEALRQHCSEIESALIERHLRRMPPAYFERFSVSEVARHLRLIAEVSATEPLALETRSLGPHVYEILVACVNFAGTVACLTSALAADQFNLEDLQIANSIGPFESDEEFEYSVINLRVSGPEEAPAEELTERLHDRMRAAFVHLASGHFAEAQAAAARAEPMKTAPTVRVAVGLVLGSDYRLEKRLARGGMSEVYLARQISLDRTVAVKVSRAEGGAEDELAARFTREALVLGQFQCPNIVPVFTTGTLPSGTGVLGWIAMEYQAGGDLARWVAQNGAAPVDLGLRWFRQAIEGLRYAHHNGVVHRDLKPHNLLLTSEGNIKVGDFGLFKYVEPDGDAAGTRRPIRGTPHYMAPEQARGEYLDERSDMFSLGTTFFHVFTGRLPFDAPTPGEVLRKIAETDAPQLLAFAPELPRPLGVLLGRMLARDKEDRYQEVSVLLTDLESYVTRGLLPVADSGSFAAADDDPSAVMPMSGLETSAYVPGVPSDPALRPS